MRQVIFRLGYLVVLAACILNPSQLKAESKTGVIVGKRFPPMLEAVAQAAKPRGVNLPRPARLSREYVKNLATNLEAFKNSAHDGFVNNVNNATNLNGEQKFIILRRVQAQSKALSKGFLKLKRRSGRNIRNLTVYELVNHSAKLIEQGLLSATTVRARAGGSACGARFVYFKSPLRRYNASEERAQAVNLIESYDGFLIQFLSSTGGDSLINQLLAVPGISTQETAYLEKLRTRLNKIFTSDLSALRTAVFCMIGKQFDNVNPEPIQILDVVPQGNAALEIMAANITSGDSNAVGGGINLNTTNQTAEINFDNVNGDDFQMRTVYDDGTSDGSSPSVTIGRSQANFDQDFSEQFGTQNGSFDMNVPLSSNSFIGSNGALGEANVTLMPGIDLSGKISIDDHGVIDGEADLSSLPMFPMTGKVMGVLNNQNDKLQLYQRVVIPSSKGTGGQIFTKYEAGSAQ